METIGGFDLYQGLLLWFFFGCVVYKAILLTEEKEFVYLWDYLLIGFLTLCLWPVFAFWLYKEKEGFLKAFLKKKSRRNK